MSALALRLGLGGLAAIIGLVALVLAASGREPPGFLLPIPVELAIGWSFVSAGLIGWARRPDNRTGLLMTLTGLVWFGRQLEWLDTPLASHLSHVSVNLFLALIAHQLVVFPSGDARTRLERMLVVSAYAVALGGYVVSKLFYDPRLEGCPGCPQNLLLVSANSQLDAVANVVPIALAILLVLAILARLARRWRVASSPARRVLGPVVWTGWAALLIVALTIGLYASEVSPALDRALQWSTLAYTAIPLAFLAGLLRTRLHRGALSGLLVDLGDAASPAAIRGALAETLGDPSLEVAFWLPDQGRYVDLDGRPCELPINSERATLVLEHEGQRVAALAYDPSLLDDPELVRAAGAAARMALENARLQAELRAQLSEVRASRARIVEAGDAERRRLERDLHDGAQQRLLGIRLALRLARGELGQGASAVEGLLGEAEDEIAQTLDELRALARGIHPAVLTEEGLGPAVETLARRASLPVQVEAVPTARLPSAVEAAAYFVVSEALANVAKHANASGVTIAMRRMSDALVIDISDDGVGGADPASGSGLIGLRDRVEALNGSLRVESPPGQGTRLYAEIPCGSAPTGRTARG
jgi:signal transduction histidine kinase